MRPPSTGHVPEFLSSWLSIYTSYAATLMFLRMSLDHCPPWITHTIVALYNYLFVKRHLGSPKQTLVIDAYDATELYNSAFIYLKTKIDPNTDRLKLVKNQDAKKFTLTFDRMKEIKDSFEDMELLWRYVVEKIGTEKEPEEKHYLELIFDKNNKDKVVNHYIPHIIEAASSIQQEDKKVKLFHRDCEGRGWDGISPRGWGCVDFEHPATFETLAMDPHLKKNIIDDLNKFFKRKDKYKKVGKAWKRGYLLYGPPGTGKSSLIAAIANYLNFDIYDLDLKTITSNSHLRRTLLATSRKSILVIEDIDCNAEVQDRKKFAKLAKKHKLKYLPGPPSRALTLSGILNVFDGLWTNIGHEKLIIFTTNHVKKIDPALLRPGRMDMRINLSYCTPHAFRQLASNYLSVKDHPLFEGIEELVKTVKVTPAEIAEQLLRSAEDVDADGVDAAFEEIMKLIRLKKIEAEKKAISKAEKKIEAEKKAISKAEKKIEAQKKAKSKAAKKAKSKEEEEDSEEEEEEDSEEEEEDSYEEEDSELD